MYLSLYQQAWPCDQTVKKLLNPDDATVYSSQVTAHEQGGVQF